MSKLGDIGWCPIAIDEREYSEADERPRNTLKMSGRACSGRTHGVAGQSSPPKPHRRASTAVNECDRTVIRASRAASKRLTGATMDDEDSDAVVMETGTYCGN